jgi:acetyltransferase-like isoleucine patch superfamily enzyme
LEKRWIKILKGYFMLGKILKFLYFNMGFKLRYWFWKAAIHSMGGKIGKNVKFYEGIRIVGNSTGAVAIGDDVRILRGVTMSTTPEGKIQIGNGVHIGEGSVIYSGVGIRIGDNVIIGPQNIIVDLDHCFQNLDLPINQQGMNGKEISIEEDVWIASQCVIIKGVTIGKGSVIAAGSIVNSSIPPYSVAAGVPAKVIKKRGET